MVNKVFINNKEECSDALTEEISMINSQYVHIDGCNQFTFDEEYLCLGYTGMDDYIILVSGTGRVFELPYDLYSFTE